MSSSIDYTLNFVLTGQRGAQYLESERFAGYPKLIALDHLKRDLVAQYAHRPLSHPYYFGTPLREVLQNRFDVIRINVPKNIPIEQLYTLRVDEICALPSFIFLSIPDSTAENLAKGRRLLTSWGFRRAEDIVWIKASGPAKVNLFQDVKQHCLMGVKGTVRRSTDSHIIHCNVDTDVILDEEELYAIIENFALGLRRLEVFTRKQRPGWVTLDKDVPATYDPAAYSNMWSCLGTHLLPQSPLIEQLRPKSR